jgi:hypothetical protein
VGSGCDEQFEFEFALDLLPDGAERLHRQGWNSAGAVPGQRMAQPGLVHDPAAVDAQ